MAYSRRAAHAGAWYEGSAAGLAALRCAIQSLINNYRAPPEDQLVDYLCGVWAASSAGELYVAEVDNVREFCNSLIERTGC